MIDGRTRIQLTRFLIGGVVATLVDASVYFGLEATLLLGRHDLAKTASFVVGTTVAWLFATLWTFGTDARDLRRGTSFVALYVVAMAVNVGGNRLALAAFASAGVPWPEVVAFVTATGCSTVVNFLGQKFWVFRGA